MKRFIALLILALFLPAAAADLGIVMYVGQTVTVNGMPVTLEDLSSKGEASISINGTSYVLTFGQKVKAGNITLVLGTVSPEQGWAKIFLFGNITSVKGLGGNVKLETRFPDIEVNPEDEITIPITVKNLGGSRYIPLNVKAPTGWKAVFTSSGMRIGGIYLNHGETANIHLLVKTGKTAGVYHLEITAGGDRLELTVTVLRNSLRAYLDYPGKEAKAGGDVKFSLHLSSNSPTIIQLDYTAPHGWKVEFLAGGNPIRMVRVNGEEVITVRVSIPSDAPVGWHEIEIKAGNVTETAHIYITETHAGENGTLSIKVVDGDSGSYVPGAKIVLYRNGTAVASTVTLPDGTATLHAPEGNYKISILKTAYKPADREVTLKAGEKTSITVRLERLPYYFEIYTPSPSKSGIIGKNVIYELILKNLGTEDDSYSLTLQVPENWGGMIVENPSSKVGITSIYVRSGEEKTLYAVLIPPDTAKLGVHNATLSIKSLKSGYSKNITLSTELKGNYGITLSLEKYSMTIQAGKNAEVNVRTYNTGSSPLTNVKLMIDAPKGWSVKVKPERIATLKKDDTAVFTLSITVPGNTDAGDYLITLRVVSDQKTAEEQLRVTVEKGGGQTYIGIGMILAALIILGVILRKYGRR
ncbi:COG1470 family protein [Thermococcus sp.]